MRDLAERRGGAGVGAAITIALHAAVAAALLAYEPARTSLAAAAPIMVDWIAPPAPPQPEQVRPPKPRPVVKRPVPPPPPAPLIASTAPPVEPAVAPAPVAPAPVPVEAPPPAPAPTPVVAAVEVTPPVFNADYLKNPAPPYPAQSRRLGEEGRVILRVLVSAAGAAEDVQIRTSSGSARLDEAARETVRQWKFQPARRGSEAIAAWVLVPIRFSLES